MYTLDIQTIPHHKQRYPTVGDWWFSSTPEIDISFPLTLHVRISNMKNWKYEFLVARHEIDEALLCLDRGITEKQVTDFDLWYENERVKNNPECQGECGEHKLAPYRKEHFFATTQERAMAAELNVNWEDYDEAVFNL